MHHEGQIGMNKEEFAQFSACLTEAYQKRFARLGTFDKLSNNKNILEYADFAIVLDIFAEMVVDEVDIEVEIVKEDLNMALGQLNSVQEETSMLSSILDSDDSESDDDLGGGFFDRLTRWRTRRSTRVSTISRSIHIKSRTPTAGATSSKEAWKTFNFDFDTMNSLLSTPQNIEQQNMNRFIEEEAQKVEELYIKTPRTINAIHDIDNASLNDASITAYMRHEAMNSSNLHIILDEEEIP